MLLFGNGGIVKSGRRASRDRRARAEGSLEGRVRGVLISQKVPQSLIFMIVHGMVPRLLPVDHFSSPPTQDSSRPMRLSMLRELSDLLRRGHQAGLIRQIRIHRQALRQPPGLDPIQQGPSRKHGGAPGDPGADWGDPDDEDPDESFEPDSSESARTSEIRSLLKNRWRESERPKSSLGSVKIEDFYGERKYRGGADL